MKPRFIDPATFRRTLVIDTPSGPRKLADVVEPWQDADFSALDPALRRVMGQSVTDSKMLGYLERARGHSKTGDLAVVCTSALVGSPSPISIAWAAGDKDQGQLGRHAINRLVAVNPQLGEKVKGSKPLIDCGAYVIRNTLTGSTLEILSADAASSWGRTDHLVVVDELSVWRGDNGETLWQSLFSEIPKRGGNAALVVISNAGFGRGVSWQWRVREAARTGSGWYFSTLDGPQASWITADSLADQRSMLPPMAYRRAWLNQWVSSTGDALTEEIIAAAFAADLPPILSACDGMVFTGGLDMSVSRDATGFIVIGKTRGDRYRLARAVHWKPAPGNKIDQAMVEETVLAAHQAYRLKAVAVDPFQAEGLVQRLQRAGVPIEIRQQQGKQLVEQAMTLVEVFNGRRIDLYDDELLRRELSQLYVEQKSYGLRLVSPRDYSHGDLVTALCIALVVAKPFMGGPSSWGGTINVGGQQRSYLNNKPAGTREKISLGGYGPPGPRWDQVK